VFGTPLISDDTDVIEAILHSKIAENASFKILNYPEGPAPECFFLVDKRLISDDKLYGHGIVAMCWYEDRCFNLSASSSLDGENLAVFWKDVSAAGYRPMQTNMVSLGSDHDYAKGPIV